MLNKSKVELVPLFLSAAGILLVGGVIFYLSSPVNKAEAVISLHHKDSAIVDLGKVIYAEHCASCHGVFLEGQANWRQRDAGGYLPAPPHDETGHLASPHLSLFQVFTIVAKLRQSIGRGF